MREKRQEKFAKRENPLLAASFAVVKEPSLEEINPDIAVSKIDAFGRSITSSPSQYDHNSSQSSMPEASFQRKDHNYSVSFDVKPAALSSSLPASGSEAKPGAVSVAKSDTAADAWEQRIQRKKDADAAPGLTKSEADGRFQQRLREKAESGAHGSSETAADAWEQRIQRKKEADAAPRLSSDEVEGQFEQRLRKKAESGAHRSSETAADAWEQRIQRKKDADAAPRLSSDEVEGQFEQRLRDKAATGNLRSSDNAADEQRIQRKIDADATPRLSSSDADGRFEQRIREKAASGAHRSTAADALEQRRQQKVGADTAPHLTSSEAGRRFEQRIKDKAANGTESMKKPARGTLTKNRPSRQLPRYSFKDEKHDNKLVNFSTLDVAELYHSSAKERYAFALKAKADADDALQRAREAKEKADAEVEAAIEEMDLAKHCLDAVEAADNS